MNFLTSGVKSLPQRFFLTFLLADDYQQSNLNKYPEVKFQTKTNVIVFIRMHKYLIFKRIYKLRDSLIIA